jgi:hypothetical protein
MHTDTQPHIHLSVNLLSAATSNRVDFCCNRDALCFLAVVACQVAPSLQLPELPEVQNLQQQQQWRQRQQQQQQQQLEPVFEWPGLHTWRSKGIDPRRSWGDKNKATADSAEPAAAALEALPLANSLVGVALQVLNTADPNHKAAITHRGWKAYCAGLIPLHEPEQQQDKAQHVADCSSSNSSSHQQRQQQQEPPDRPARPAKPQLVIPKHVPSPKDSPLPLNAHMLHNLVRCIETATAKAAAKRITCAPQLMAVCACEIM